MRRFRELTHRQTYNIVLVGKHVGSYGSLLLLVGKACEEPLLELIDLSRAYVLFTLQPGKMQPSSRKAIFVVVGLVVLLGLVALWNVDNGKVRQDRPTTQTTQTTHCPEPAREDPTSPQHFFLPAGYEQRYENIYDHEPAAAEKTQSWQYLVYNYAKYLLETHPKLFTRVIDIGCGSGAKLVPMKDLVPELVCVDFTTI